MKKIFSLVLALVMMLALAVPAMAFTSDTTDSSSTVPYELDIYLVDYEGDEFFGFVSLPESDRGYAVNEIVCAVVELYVPKAQDPYDDGYSTLVFSGNNVSLKVTDNVISGSTATLQTVYGPTSFDWDGDDISYDLSDNDFYYTANRTYKWMFFAKVTGDDASLSASLVDGESSGSFSTTASVSSIDITLSGVNYTITKSKSSSSTAGTYTIAVNTGDYAGSSITINVSSSYKSTGMSINPVGSTGNTALGVTVGGVLGVYDDAVIRTSGNLYEEIMDIYADVAQDIFGLDYMLIGNYVRDSFFEGLTSASTVTAAVQIEPWTAYVTVPDTVVVDPPKTGDAASILGFTIIFLAAAAAAAAGLAKKSRA